jgi:hypothetical protein
LPPADDGAVTLRDIVQRLDGVADRLASLDGRVTAALADGARAMGELRDEIRSLRQDRDSDRERLRRVEGAVEQWEQRQADWRAGRWWVWGWIVQGVLSVSGWVEAFWHPFQGRR